MSNKNPKKQEGPRISYCCQKAQYLDMPGVVVIKQRIQFKGACTVQAGQFSTEKQKNPQNLRKKEKVILEKVMSP